MKMFRFAFAGVLPAFVLLVCIQLNARAAWTPPPDMQSWFTGDDTVNDHIWQRWARSTTAPLPPRPRSLRRPSQGNSSLRIVSLTSEQLKKSTGAIASGRRSVLIPSHRSMR